MKISVQSASRARSIIFKISYQSLNLPLVYFYIFSQTRSFALRDLGFEATSSADGLIGKGLIIFASAFWGLLSSIANSFGTYLVFAFPRKLFEPLFDESIFQRMKGNYPHSSIFTK